MQKNQRKQSIRNWAPVLVCLAVFGLWTWLVCRVDVQAIGPEGSSVGFAALNGAFHRLTGVHMQLYILTDWLGLVPVAFCLGFGVLGLAQWIGRKQLLRVDRDLLALGGFYLLVMAAYLLFEQVVINHRPVLIEGRLEVSYPSSTTLLSLCVLPTAAMQLRRRIRRPLLRGWVVAALWGFTGFMVVGRLLSGVHWLTDILGGILLSTALVHAYTAAFQSISRIPSFRSKCR